MCNVTGIIYKVEDFLQPVSVMQCFNCQSFGHSAKNCRSKQKCLICGESHSHHGCPNKEARKPKCANCSGPHVASYKGCPEYKKQAFRQHVVKNHPAQNASDISIYRRAINKIRSQCGTRNCPATSVLPKPKAGHA